MDAKVARLAAPLCKPRPVRFGLACNETRVVGTRSSHLSRNRERGAQVGGIVVRVFDVGLGADRVMWLEVPMHHLGVVIVIDRQMHVLWWQRGQPQDAQRPEACRYAPQNPPRHVAEYIGTRPAHFTEEKFRKTSGDRPPQRR